MKWDKVKIRGEKEKERDRVQILDKKANEKYR